MGCRGHSWRNRKSIYFLIQTRSPCYYVALRSKESLEVGVAGAVEFRAQASGVLETLKPKSAKFMALRLGVGGVQF